MKIKSSLIDGEARRSSGAHGVWTAIRQAPERRDDFSDRFECEKKTSKMKRCKPREMPPTNPKQPSSSIRGLQRAVQELMNVPTFAATATATATATGISSCKIIFSIPIPIQPFSPSLDCTLTHSPCGDAKRRRPKRKDRSATARREQAPEKKEIETIQSSGNNEETTETEKWLITAEKMVEGSDPK